jgi:dTDP-4-dehydrorhamnose reductase
VKLLVTGRHGQIARSIAERAPRYPGLDIQFAVRPEVDLARPGSLAAAVRASRPNVLINAAGYTDVERAEQERDLAWRINADAGGEAAAAASSVGAAIVQISTDYVFDGRLDRPYREDDPVNPINVYGETKAAGEEQVRGRTGEHMILRTSWVYSPFERNFVKSIVRIADERDLLTVVDDQRGCPSSALDLADALLLVVDRWGSGDGTGLGETFHLAGSGETSWYGLASEVMRECRRLGLPTADVKPIRSANWPTKARRPLNSMLDCGKFERAFGFCMPDWRGSVALVVERLAAGR